MRSPVREDPVLPYANKRTFTGLFSCMGHRWKKYKKRFLNLCVALNIQDDKQKLALLLNYVGEELYDIYDSLLVPTTDGSHETYEHAIKLLDGHLNPKSNGIYELYLFRNLKQNIDELIQAFYVRVKQQAIKCNFGENLENEIKQQLYCFLV